MKQLIDKLEGAHQLQREEYQALLKGMTPQWAEELARRARAVQQRVFGRDIFLRGLIEVSSFCKNDCLYCGLRRSNARAQRYRLGAQEILDCCEQGYQLGFRTFVLQGGEDGRFSDAFLLPLIREIKQRYPQCALTLSLGERSRASYFALRAAGADRYLLRHESADPAHYSRLHPPELRFETRRQCLLDLKEAGFQVGCGFMVGSPGQETGHLVEDLLFIQGLQPHMVGIGPFIPHKDTPFADQPPGSAQLTRVLLSLVRLMLPKALLPATTALGTLCPGGREQGIASGANVLMPNLSPQDVRGKYLLYNNKLSDGKEAAESFAKIQQDLAAIGYQGVVARGDHPDTPAIEKGGTTYV